MRRVLPVALLLLLWGRLAHADWYWVTVPGVPKDLQLQDAGQIAITTDQLAQSLFVAPDGTVSLRSQMYSDGGVYVGAFEHSPGCLGAVSSNRRYSFSSPACGAGYLLPVSLSPDRMRHSASGLAYLGLADFGDSFLYFYFSPSGGAVNDWDALDGGVASGPRVSTAISALRVGASDYAAFNPSSPHWAVAKDREIVNGFDWPGSPVPPRELVLFAEGNSPAGLAVIPDGGLEKVWSAISPSPALIPVTLEPPPAAVTGVGFSSEGGGQHGMGFGLATALLSDGGTAFYSAVPDPSSLGLRWIENLRLPRSPPGDAGRVSCIGAQFCAVLLANSSASGPNLVVHWNNNPPSFSTDAGSFLLDLGQSANVLREATDPDGDGVFLSLSPADGGAQPLAIARVDGGWTLAANDAGYCSATEYELTARASDGYAPHTQAQPVWIRRPPPLAPQVVPDGGRVSLGGSISFTADSGLEGCPKTTRWSSDSGTSLGPTFTYTAPTGCYPDGGWFELRARADDGQQLSPETVLWVEIEPGGVPDRPSVSPVAQSIQPDSGNATFIASNPTGCSPLGYSWTGDAGLLFTADGGQLIVQSPPRHCGPLPWSASFQVVAVGPDGASSPASASLTVLPVDEQYAPSVSPTSITVEQGASSRVFQPSAPGASCPVAYWDWSQDGGPPLVWSVGDAGELIVTPACDLGTAHFAVRAHGVTDAGSPESWVSLTVREAPPDGGRLLLSARPMALPRAAVEGSVQVASLPCAAQRSIQVKVELRQPGAGVEEDSVVVNTGVDAGFRLEAREPCTRGDFEVIAWMVEAPELPPAVLPVRLEGLPAGVNAFQGQPTLARCGEPVLIRFSADAGDHCPWQELSWRIVESELPFAATAVTGNGVGLSTASADPGELVGQWVRFELVADGGAGNAVRVEERVQLTAEPFIGVEHRTDSPVASETQAIGVEVILTNRLGCAVGGVDYRERLDGLRYLPGTARLEGVPVEASEAGGVLSVRGLAFQAGQRVRLSYLARPPLLGKPAPRGQAWVRDVNVSGAERGFGDPTRLGGCGCSGAAEGALAIAGLLLLSLKRRNRSRLRLAAEPPMMPPHPRFPEEPDET